MSRPRAALAAPAVAALVFLGVLGSSRALGSAAAASLVAPATAVRPAYDLDGRWTETVLSCGARFPSGFGVIDITGWNAATGRFAWRPLRRLPAESSVSGIGMESGGNVRFGGGPRSPGASINVEGLFSASESGGVRVVLTRAGTCYHDSGGNENRTLYTVIYTESPAPKASWLSPGRAK